jgi:hypothetical protein
VAAPGLGVPVAGRLIDPPPASESWKLP